MGLLIDGKWVDAWYDTKSTNGDFKRESSKFRNWVTPSGEVGPTGLAGFQAESGRYHLYVSLACPWAHRTLIFRSLKGLEPHISLSVVSPEMLDQGWTFDQDASSTGDAVNQCTYLHQVYTRAQSDYSGRVTVPVLWDKQKNCIVNNESADIIRMFNYAFDSVTNNTSDFYPQAHRAEIDTWNDLIYEKVNNGVYRCGFATLQEAYDEAYQSLFDCLDKLEAHLSENRYLVGGQITEADWRLFTTLIRFDAVYHGHFKCNRQRLEDFPVLSNYLRELYQWPAIAETVNFAHIKRHYYFSHTMINPTQIVPVGPAIDYSSRHDRAALASF